MPKFRVKVSRLVLQEDVVVIEASSQEALERYLDEVETDSTTTVLGRAGRNDRANVVLGKGAKPALCAGGRHVVH